MNDPDEILASALMRLLPLSIKAMKIKSQAPNFILGWPIVLEIICGSYKHLDSTKKLHVAAFVARSVDMIENAVEAELLTQSPVC